MLMALVLTVLIVGLVLVGLKLIWEGEPDEPIEPPTTAGHLDQGWPTSGTAIKFQEEGAPCSEEQEGTMRKYGQLTLSVVFATTFMGCAGMIDGKRQTVTFNSDPRGADVVMNGVPRGVTPLTINIKREQEAVVIVRKEGYQDQTLELSTTVNPWFLGNIIWGLWFPLSSTTDVASGAAVEYDPDHYYVTLPPGDASHSQRSLLEKQMWARTFILTGYSHIAADLAKGEGEYLTSLYDILGVEEGARDETFIRLRELFLQQTDKPSVAEAVVDSFPLGGSS